MAKKSITEILQEKYELQQEMGVTYNEVSLSCREVEILKGKNHFILLFDDTKFVHESNIVEIRELNKSDLWVIIEIDNDPSERSNGTEYVYVIE